MNWQGSRVLITGVSGFVGSHLARYLLRRGATVYGLIRRTAHEAKPVALVELGIADQVVLLEADLLDIAGIGSVLDSSQPQVVFHLGAQSFVPRSFVNPLETGEINILGTINLLEAIRIKGVKPRVVFAGSSEEYGLVISSEMQWQRARAQLGNIFPPPFHIPELPVTELSPLRPMSPYAASKVAGDYLMRTYASSFGLDTVVSRAFNHEGAGRGRMFVTSTIVRQVMQLKVGERDSIEIGNVNAFRDWSHIDDILEGYTLLAESGERGEVYNQGSERSNSILSYLLLSLELAGYRIDAIETMRNGKRVDEPTKMDSDLTLGVRFAKTKVDRLLLEDRIIFEKEDEGIWVLTEHEKIPIQFDSNRFRPADVPILLADTAKIRNLGFSMRHSLADIIRDQLNYYLDPIRRA